MPFKRVRKGLIYYAVSFAMDCFLSGYSPPSLIYDSSVFEKSNANNGLCSVVVATSHHQLRFIRQIRPCFLPRSHLLRNNEAHYSMSCVFLKVIECSYS